MIFLLPKISNYYQMKNGKPCLGIINFNDFVDTDENVTTAEVRHVQEIATEIQDDANADVSDNEENTNTFTDI